MIPNIRIIARKELTKNKKLSFRIFWRYNKERKFLTLKIFADPDQWNFKKDCFIKIDDNTRTTYNFYLQRINQYLTETIINQKNFDFEDLRFFISKANVKENFTEFIKSKLSDKAAQWEASTLKSYKSHYNKLNEFKKLITFQEVNKNFIDNYKSFLIIRGNNKNSVNKALSVLRTFVKWCYPEYIKENIFENIKIKKIIGNREFLSLSELKLLHQLYLQNSLRSEHQNTLKVFLFCCYTGLRYSDVNNLKIENCNFRDHKISITQQKNSVNNVIYLPQKAIELIENKESVKALKVYTNQVLNRNLKEVSEIAGLNKNITCHSARHTFATISLNDAKIDIVKVSAALGHKDISTTRIYAHLLEKTKLEAFEAWDNF